MDKKSFYELTKDEFARQADALSVAPIFTDSSIIERIKSAACVTGGLRMLDVGCGPGIVTVALAADASEVVAFDLSPDMIHRARQRCEEAGLTNVRCEIGQAEELPFDNATFDVVVTRLTFHHFLDPAVAISEMARVLRPDGRIVAADIISSEVPEESELHNALEILRDPSHVRMMSLTEFGQLVESAELSIKAEDGWIKRREFHEWIKITNAPERAKPLYAIMRSLAEAKVKAGVDLRFDGTTVEFDHRWILLIMEKKAL